MGEPKDHHLLPRFYLSGFCHEKVHAAENHDGDRSRCRVWVRDRERNEIRVRGVKNLSVERHYYSAETPAGGRDPGPEKALSRVEDRAAPIIKALYYGWEPSPGERTILAYFAALMKFRVSGYRPWALRYADENGVDIRKRVFPSPEALRESLKSHGHPEAEDPEVVERVFRDIHSGAYELTLTKNHMLEHVFRISGKVAGALLDKQWVFGWAPEGASFVASDDPFVLQDPALGAPPGYMGDIGFAIPRGVGLLPLTQKVCLVTLGRGKGVHHLEYSRKDVRDINVAQMKYYDRWLIARDEALVKRLVS